MSNHKHRSILSDQFDFKLQKRASRVNFGRGKNRYTTCFGKNVFLTCGSWQRGCQKMETVISKAWDEEF